MHAIGYFELHHSNNKSLAMHEGQISLLVLASTAETLV